MYDHESERDRGRAIANEAQGFLDRAKASGRSLTDPERARVKELIEASRDAHDSAKIAQQIDEMRAPAGKSSPSRNPMFDRHELASFVKAVAAGEPARVKATLVGSGAGMVGDYRVGTTGTLTEPFRVASLFNQESTDAASVWFRRITTGSSTAAAVAEGGLKPEATIVAAQVEAPVRKVATFLPVADEVRDDGGEAFVRDLTDDLVRDLIRAENAQLLNGDGLAPNLRGILATSGIGTRLRGTDTNLDALIKATTQLRAAFVEPAAIVLNPANFEAIRLAKDAAGQYVLGSPLTGRFGNERGVGHPGRETGALRA